MNLGRLNHVGVATASIDESIWLCLYEAREKGLENSWKQHDQLRP